MNEPSSYHEMIAEQIRQSEDKLDALKLIQQKLDQLDFSIDKVEELVTKFFFEDTDCFVASKAVVENRTSSHFMKGLEGTSEWSIGPLRASVYDKYIATFQDWFNSRIRSNEHPIFGYGKGPHGGIQVKARARKPAPIVENPQPKINAQTRLSELRKLLEYVPTYDETEFYAKVTPRGWAAAAKMAQDMPINQALVGPTEPAINDHTCPSCGNNKVSKNEKSCWSCGNPL
jgi:hypothetical protein